MKDVNERFKDASREAARLIKAGYTAVSVKVEESISVQTVIYNQLTPETEMLKRDEQKSVPNLMEKELHGEILQTRCFTILLIIWAVRGSLYKLGNQMPATMLIFIRSEARGCPLATHALSTTSSLAKSAIRRANSMLLVRDTTQVRGTIHKS
jgi:hypothetical protein